MSNTRRIGFRGDNREPEVIFHTGMKPHETDKDITYDGDTKRGTAVSFTWNLGVGTYFPLEPEKETTWIYVLSVDLLEGSKDSIFNSRLTHFKGIDSEVSDKTKSKLSNIHGAQYFEIQKHSHRGNKALRFLFAEEMAIKEIKPKDILFAVKCVREYNNPEDCKDGLSYQLIGPIVDNPAFKPGKLSPDMITKARELINTEIQLSAAQKIKAPEISSGYHKNEVATEHKKTFK